MIIIPAIDIYQGHCVRLQQGNFSKKTVFYQDPFDAALYWYEQGAKRLHIVDLDGAKNATTTNLNKIIQITQSINVPVQIGGGIRNIDQLKDYFNGGIRSCILGTTAIINQDFFIEACKKFPNSIIAGLDAINENISISGWQQESGKNIFDCAKWSEAVGAEMILYTDISRDGMLTGVNLDNLKKLTAKVSIPLIASGGVANIDDIKSLINLNINIFGVIAGRALYQKTLDLQQANSLLESYQKIDG